MCECDRNSENCLTEPGAGSKVPPEFEGQGRCMSDRGVTRLHARFGTVMQELLKFGIVGGVGLIVDVGLFNILISGPLAAGRVAGAVLIAKAIATTAAILTNWVGNRWWTFRTRHSDRAGAEALKFFVVSVAGSVIALLCLALSHYAFGLTTPLADNVSANVIGLALGSLFRFVVVRAWVFRGPEVDASATVQIPVAVTTS